MTNRPFGMFSGPQGSFPLALALLCMISPTAVLAQQNPRSTQEIWADGFRGTGMSSGTQVPDYLRGIATLTPSSHLAHGRDLQNQLRERVSRLTEVRHAQ